MTKETAPFSRAKLQDTDEMAARFYRFGLEGWPHWMIGQELGCHANTVYTFLRRAPKSSAAHRNGLEEAAAQGGLIKGNGLHAQRAWRAARRPAEPKPGEMCPTCRQTVAEGQQSIILTAAEIMEAQRTLDELIERHLAADRADGAGQDGASEGGQAG